VHKWTILDGDVDPGWIESCNTVMDDNKVLTLVSNDRIPLSPSMRLLFEVSNLKNATPATVSRGGVLFINETDIGWMPFVNSWLERTQLYMQPSDTGQNVPYPKLDEPTKTVFMRCFQTYIDQPGDIHDPNKMITIAPTQLIGLIGTLTSLLDSLLLEHAAAIAKVRDSGTQDEDLKMIYEALFIFAGMWAFGGSIGGGQDDEALIKTFNGIWRSYSKVKFPDQNYCYDYYWSMEELKWASWANKVQPYEAPEDINFNKIYVNTTQTTRMKYMLNTHLARRKPILFIGGAGTGKTSLVRDFLASTRIDQVTHKTINFSSFTDAASLQGQIESMLEKKSGKTYGSATNKVLIMFIDDLNMPKLDTYGTQSPIQLLRQIIDYASIFNLEQLEERKFIQDLLFFASLNHKSGSFIIDLRLQKNFSVFAQNTPSQDVIKTIFGSILAAFFANPGWDAKIKGVSDKLVDSTIVIFQKLLKNNQFSPSARKFHYQFNYRELAKVVEGIMRSTPSGYKSVLNMQRIWNHEVSRVFEDRFINDEDINVFRTYVREGLVKNFGEVTEKEDPFAEPCLFTTFVADHRGQEPLYLPVASTEELKEVLTEKLEEYNDVKPQMNLVLFNQAMEHVCKICRIITLVNGNALLVGVGGSGKQSLARLSVFINGFEFEQMLVTQQFNMNDLRTYLSDMYRKIAKPNSNSRVFVLNDSQIKDEAFLIPINDMLNAGWISDLFTKEDFEALVNNLRNEAKSSGVADNTEALSTYFLEKMKKNLKVVLCFSPVGDAMRVRSRKFPGIINSTSIDWFHPWPKGALIDVGSRFLEETELAPDLIEKIALNMAETHISIDKANEMFRKL
jgi:dynein heavy chain